MAGKKTSVIQVMIAGDSSDLQKATRGGVSGFNLLAGAAIAATKIMVSAATAIAGFSIREFAKFDEAMTKSTAIMGDLSDTMRKDMSDAARQVALETTFAADEAAEAFFFLASAGLTAEQSIAALPQVARFAQAGAFDLALATDLLTDAQSALGLTSDDTAENILNMARVSDVLAKANTVSNATIQEFSEALTEKAGVAMRQLGIDIEEGTAALAVFADQGVKGTKAGTLLNTTLEGLARTADQNKEAYDALGVSVFDNEGEMRNLADIVGDLEGAFDGMSTQARNAELRNLGFTRQARDGVLQLLGNADALREYESELRNAAGTTDEIAEKQLQSFNAQLSLLRSGLSDVAISIGEALAGPLGRLVTWFQDQIPAIKAFVEEAIPQVEAFVDRAKTKFQEFKQFYDDNLAEPLGDLMERLRGLAGDGLGFVAEFRERALEFLGDFAQAVADADSEEAGTVLGEAIGDLIVLGFDKVSDFGEFVADWAAQQDWTAIGLSLSKHFGKFVKGLFMGLTHSMNEESGEIEFDGSKVVKVVIAGLVARIPMVRNAMAARSGIFAIPIIGSLLANILRLARAATPGLGRFGTLFATKVSSLFGMAFGMAFGGTKFANLIGSAMTAMRLLFTGQFGTFFSLLGTNIASGLSGLITLLVGGIRGWFSQIVIGLRMFGSSIAGWFTRGGLMLVVRGIIGFLTGAAAVFFGWPVILFAAAVAAFAIFTTRFINWLGGEEEEYESVGEALVAFIGQGIQNMKDWFHDNITQWFSDRIMAFSDWADTLNGDYENVGQRIILGMIDGVKSFAGRLVQSVKDAVKGAIFGAEQELGIKSPSMVFARIGDDVMAGMSLGIDRSSMDAVGAMVDASRQLTGVNFSAPQVPVGSARGGMGGNNINITVTSADPQAVVEALRKYTRANGPLGAVVTV